MNQAFFSLQNYVFDKVSIDLSKLQKDSSLSLDITPSGIYREAIGEYELSFVFTAFQGENEKNEIVSVRCKATYKFQQPISFDSFPKMFYANSIAILFPYVRAFVSTVTLQANILPPIIIPTLNLTSLESRLSANTVVE